jgi:hypothetical protein
MGMGKRIRDSSANYNDHNLAAANNDNATGNNSA